MEPGDIGSASQEIEIAFFLVSQDFSGGSCWVQLPKGCKAKVEAIGRDDEGGFLHMEDGNVLRMRAPGGQVEEFASDLDELLSKDEVVIQELDEFQTLRDEYPVGKVPYENRIGFGA